MDNNIITTESELMHWMTSGAKLRPRKSLWRGTMQPTKVYDEVIEFIANAFRLVLASRHQLKLSRNRKLDNGCRHRGL
ncbi:hypothetical protein BH20ACI3_BH20ACI3_08320 [soil metagenome]